MLAWLWAPTVCLAVVATGNHFVADIVVGAVVTGVGYGLGKTALQIGRGDRRAPVPVPALATGA